MAIKRKVGPKRATRVGKAKTRKAATTKKTPPRAAEKPSPKAAKKAVKRTKAKTKPTVSAAAPATTATFDLKLLIREAVAQRQARRELLDKLGSGSSKPRAGAAADTDPVTNMRRRILRYRLTVGPHTPGEGEDDSTLPSVPLMGGPRGGGDPEDA